MPNHRPSIGNRCGRESSNPKQPQYEKLMIGTHRSSDQTCRCNPRCCQHDTYYSYVQTKVMTAKISFCNAL